MQKSIFISLFMGFLIINGCGGNSGGNSTSIKKSLEGNVTITIEKIDKQTNKAKIHIVTDINEANYVFDNNKNNLIITDCVGYPYNHSEKQKSINYEANYHDNEIHLIVQQERAFHYIF